LQLRRSILRVAIHRRERRTPSRGIRLSCHIDPDTGVQGGTELVNCGRSTSPLLGCGHRVARLKAREVERRISRRNGRGVEE
jgi:hypothetical protein